MLPWRGPRTTPAAPALRPLASPAADANDVGSYCNEDINEGCPDPLYCFGFACRCSFDDDCGPYFSCDGGGTECNHMCRNSRKDDAEVGA
jgi:hypothetical protein